MEAETAGRGRGAGELKGPRRLPPGRWRKAGGRRAEGGAAAGRERREGGKEGGKEGGREERRRVSGPRRRTGAVLPAPQPPGRAGQEDAAEPGPPPLSPAAASGPPPARPGGIFPLRAPVNNQNNGQHKPVGEPEGLHQQPTSTRGLYDQRKRYGHSFSDTGLFL